MKETGLVEMWTRVLVFFIGLLSTIGILYTFGWEAFSLKAVGLRGIIVLFFSICVMYWSAFSFRRYEKEDSK